MSCTRSSPSCESRNRETASYSYRPCCALLVDLMCHSYSGRASARAISCASCVLPVPGSPLMSSGRASVMAAFTAIIRSSVATYRSVPVKRCRSFIGSQSNRAALKDGGIRASILRPPVIEHRPFPQSTSGGHDQQAVADPSCVGALELWSERQGVLNRARQERQRLTQRPFPEARAIVG